VVQQIQFDFGTYGYRIHFINDTNMLVDKLYTQLISDEDSEAIAKKYGNWVLEQISLRMKK